MTALYRQIFVWKRLNETTAARYCCFEDLSSGRFCVQNADFLPPSSVNSVSLVELEKQIVELFVEDEPSVRAQSYPTLQEAIDAHDAEFENFFEDVAADDRFEGST